MLVRVYVYFKTQILARKYAHLVRSLLLGFKLELHTLDKLRVDFNGGIHSDSSYKTLVKNVDCPNLSPILGLNWLFIGRFSTENNLLVIHWHLKFRLSGNIHKSKWKTARVVKNKFSRFPVKEQNKSIQDRSSV